MYPLPEEESGCDEDEEDEEEEIREEEEFDSDESLVDSDSDSDEKGLQDLLRYIRFFFLFADVNRFRSNVIVFFQQTSKPTWRT